MEVMVKEAKMVKVVDLDKKQVKRQEEQELTSMFTGYALVLLRNTG